MPTLQDLRRRKFKTIKAFAEAIGFTSSRASQWLRGRDATMLYEDETRILEALQTGKLSVMLRAGCLQVPGTRSRSKDEIMEEEITIAEEAHAETLTGQGIDITEELLAWEQGRMELSFFILDVLRLLNEYDCYSDPVYWAYQGQYAPITFFVNCNDLFYWACADAEKLTPEDMPALRQALRDTLPITGKADIYIGFELWVARKRKMRPQSPAYPQDARLRALFDACGPIRTSEEG